MQDMNATTAYRDITNWWDFPLYQPNESYIVMDHTHGFRTVRRICKTKMEEDIITEQHSHKLAREFNLANVENLKTERITTRGTDISSCWLATKNRDVRCFVQYHSDELQT